MKYLESWLGFRYERNDFWPGFTVAVSYKGQVKLNKSFGFANLEKKDVLTPNHIFRIASHSKTFTATAIMQLFEQKKLDLDDSIIKHLPWLEKHKDKRFSKVTIKMLLSHQAGIIRDGLDADFWLLERAFPNEEEFIKLVLESDLAILPGKKMKYSNIGFTLLGLIIEKVAETTYNKYVVENIVKPLGLKNTGPEFDPNLENKMVTGYSIMDSNRKRPAFEKNVDTKVMSSATGFYSTSEDICEYLSAQNLGSKKLLTDESKKLMQKEIVKIPKPHFKESYGLGFASSEINKKKFFGHGGSFPGQSTETIADPTNSLVITVLTNCIDGNAAQFAGGVFSIIDYFQKNFSLNNKIDLTKFEKRLTNIWGIFDVVSMGDHLVLVEPDTYRPFDFIEQLKFVDNTTLKVGTTNGFYSEGELINYVFDKNGKVESVKYAGLTMRPV